MPLLTKDQIIAAPDRQFVEVEVPEWGGKVRLASFDADQALQHTELMKKREKGQTDLNPLSAMLAASIVDENGNRIFNEKDMSSLGKKSPTVLVKLVEEVRKLNELDDKEVNVGNTVASPGA